nr:putative NHL domain-containing protein [Tanacetum cinerariifolium]
MYYHFKIPNNNLDHGLQALGNDADVMNLVRYINKYRFIEVFIEHEYTVLETYWKTLQKLRLEEIDDVESSALARKAICRVIFSEQYSLLRDYVLELQRTNEDTTVKIDLERDYNPSETTRQFKRIYVCIGALKRGFKEGLRDLFGLDGCFIKGQYPGQLLTAVGINANHGIYPLAYAILETENTSYWSLFLTCLGDDLDLNPMSNFTFIYDRQKIERPPKSRKKSAGEISSQKMFVHGKLSRAGKLVTCDKCGMKGHNITSCKRSQASKVGGSQASKVGGSQASKVEGSQASSVEGLKASGVGVSKRTRGSQIGTSKLDNEWYRRHLYGMYGQLNPHQIQDIATEISSHEQLIILQDEFAGMDTELVLTQKNASELLLEEGYTVTTLVDGDKFSLNPNAVGSSSSHDDDVIVLDSVKSSVYTVSFIGGDQVSEIKKLSGSANGEAGYKDGDLGSAEFNKPKSFAIDRKNNIYIADKSNHVIRKISKSGVTTIAGGNIRKTGKADGPAQNASFSDDFELAFDPQRCALLIADHGNRLVRQLNLKVEDCADGNPRQQPILSPLLSSITKNHRVMKLIRKAYIWEDIRTNNETGHQAN